ncbi:MAG: lipid II:glycine glycyltransferase (peptidoglycan interpeptide bridge formation enzyme) [Ancylomarina sp.]|jgi:lipid II:glycine glycyltransferase (peptidoglycan interpeptide bridge formation enzyme)
MDLRGKTYSWTSEEKDMKDWDNFLRDNPRGNCQQVSHWLTSFQNYGFKSEVLLIKNDENKIVAGIGAVYSKLPILRVFLAPSGPILSSSYEDLFEPVLNLFLHRAKEKKVFYCHINVPVLKFENSKLKEHCLGNIPSDSILFSSECGNEFQYVASINGLRPIYIDYNQETPPYELVKKGFKRNTRDNIRLSYKNGFELKYANSEKEIEEAYELIVENAKQIDYSIRSWTDSRDMLLGMAKSNTCIIPCCYDHGILKGVLIVFDIGQRLTPMYGGILREKKDLKIGHFMHNEMLKLSIEKAYDIYDISVIGSEGVTRFKKGFGSEYVEFIGNRYWILNQFKFNIYKRINSFVAKNKAFVFRILNFVS